MILINGKPLNFTLFPDNTSQVWKVKELEIPGTNWVSVRWNFQHEGEFMQLAQLKDLLDASLFRCTLFISYLPYGRQDKPISNNATFGLVTFAKLLNSLNFEEIIITDAHSKIATDLIKNSVSKLPDKAVSDVAKLVEYDITCFPDHGAAIKYCPDFLNQKVAYGVKTRDPSTGIITSYELKGFNPKNLRVLIIDDICDGGATFKILSEKLYNAGAREVNLFVTHGIFSKGLKPLLDSGIKRIFTKDGEVSEYQNNITYRKL